MVKGSIFCILLVGFFCLFVCWLLLRQEAIWAGLHCMFKGMQTVTYLISDPLEKPVGAVCLTCWFSEDAFRKNGSVCLQVSLEHEEELL